MEYGGEQNTAQARYNQLERFRSPFLDRAQACSELTIPHLFPPDGHSEESDLPQPYQSLGARGTNNLTHKLLLGQFPPNTPFFRLVIDEQTLQEIGAEEEADKVDEALAQIERLVVSKLETGIMRAQLAQAIKQLIVGGNALLYLSPENTLRVYKLNNYVIKRDPSGNVLEIITSEKVSPDVLPAEIQQEVKNKTKAQDEKTAKIFTRIYLTEGGDQWRVYQECYGITIPGTEGTYELNRSPWIPLRWHAVDGEDYGRGHIEEYFGDLKSLEGLMEAAVQAAAVSSQIKFLVNPNSSTDIDQLAEAENGAIIDGKGDDVSVIQAEKFADMRVSFQVIQMLQERLAQAFLLNSAVQRDAERVTAEEIRYVAQELEDNLGGVYTILSTELSLPLVRVLLHRMQSAKELPRLPEDLVEPMIVTGLEALGRGHDLQKLQTFLALLQPLGEQILQSHIHIDAVITRIGTSLGINMEGLVKTPEEIAAMQEQDMQMQMMSQLGPNAVNQAGNLAAKSMEQGGEGI